MTKKELLDECAKLNEQFKREDLRKLVTILKELIEVTENLK